MMLFWLIVVVVIIVAVALLMRQGGWSDRPSASDRAEDELRKRYARGELDEETFRRMQDELRR